MDYLLMNLAIADMVVAIFFVPRHILIHTFRHPDGMTGTLVCKLLTGGNLAWVGGTASIVTLVAIAIERYYTVLYPLRNNSRLTYGKLKVRQASYVFNQQLFFFGTCFERFSKCKDLTCGWWLWLHSIYFLQQNFVSLPFEINASNNIKIPGPQRVFKSKGFSRIVMGMT